MGVPWLPEVGAATLFIDDVFVYEVDEADVTRYLNKAIYIPTTSVAVTSNSFRDLALKYQIGRYTCVNNDVVCVNNEIVTI